jgi:hypothetical protein
MVAMGTVTFLTFEKGGSTVWLSMCYNENVIIIIIIIT